MTKILKEGEEAIFRTDEVLFEQGSDSEGVYVILDGRVDLWRTDEGQTKNIATIHSGDLLGEVSVIEDTHHSVSAIAAKPTSTLFVSKESFKRSFSSPLVRFVVHTLATRLRGSYAGSTPHEIKSTSTASKHPVLMGSCNILNKMIPTPIELTVFPFTVGNRGLNKDELINNGTILQLPLPHYHEMIAEHFEITKRDGGLILKDLSGTAGTNVNGDLVKKYGSTAIAKLRPGQNIISIGNENGDALQFTVTVPWTEID